MSLNIAQTGFLPFISPKKQLCGDLKFKLKGKRLNETDYCNFGYA